MALRSGLTRASLRAAELLDEVGTHEDVALLRSLARSRRADVVQRQLGRKLARKLAPRLFVEDQGRVRLRLGERVVEGSEVRRKVLSLLCLLLSRPNFSATRDEVLDALWPDLEPNVAGNSLNQTVYFLRRVIEPDYAEETSAGYVHFEANILWLDAELVQSRSDQCWSLVRSMGDERRPEDVSLLARLYRDRFAMDFAYEEWAIPYREALHASFLQVMEKAVADDVRTGHFDRGVALIRSALAVDRDAEDLEAFLVRLYNVTGAHAAAAEQYAHYSSVLRTDYGMEPPALDALN
jgi:DNA-binding SARP family transcriptional activator